MKPFEEYKDYLAIQIKHLLINDDNDLLNLTKLLLNYGKVALKYYPKEIDLLIKELAIYGLKEDELLSNHIKVEFKGNLVVFKTSDNKTYSAEMASFSNSIEKHQGNTLDLMIALSVSLVNKKQELFQIVSHSK